MIKQLLGVTCVALCLASLTPAKTTAPSAASTSGPAVAAPVRDVSNNAGDQMGNGYNAVTLTRADDGHFYTDATVNGTVIRFMVDTGASTIALTKADAQSAGLHFSSGEFTGFAQGAGGKIPVKSVMLDRVAVGTMEARGVPAAILDGELRVSLLGQSWLSRVGRVTIENDRMMLR
jgi:aspartyl protease family protein